jgi:hypothetical protein
VVEWEAAMPRQKGKRSGLSSCSSSRRIQGHRHHYYHCVCERETGEKDKDKDRIDRSDGVEECDSVIASSKTPPYGALSGMAGRRNRCRKVNSMSNPALVLVNIQSMSASLVDSQSMFGEPFIIQHQINVGLRFQTRPTLASLPVAQFNPRRANNVFTDFLSQQPLPPSLTVLCMFPLLPVALEVKVLGSSCDIAFTYVRSVEASVDAITSFLSILVLPSCTSTILPYRVTISPAIPPH